MGGQQWRAVATRHGRIAGSSRACSASLPGWTGARPDRARLDGSSRGAPPVGRGGGIHRHRPSPDVGVVLPANGRRPRSGTGTWVITATGTTSARSNPVGGGGPSGAAPGVRSGGRGRAVGDGNHIPRRSRVDSSKYVTGMSTSTDQRIFPRPPLRPRAWRSLWCSCPPAETSTSTSMSTHETWPKPWA